MANDVLDRNRQAAPEDDDQQRKPRFGGAHPEHATDGHQGVYDEKFKDLQASGAMGADPEAKQATPEKLKSAEESGATPTPARGDKKEQAASGEADQIGDGYDAHDSGGLGGKIKSWFTGKAGKRKAIGVSIAGLLSVGALGLFSVLHGPFQLLHLSQILGRFSGAHDSAISRRIGHLTRSSRVANTGDIGESRVTVLGSRRFRAVEAQLKDAGIEYQRRTATGRPTSLTVEAAKNPKLRGKTLEQTRSNIAKFYDIDVGKVNQVSGLGDGKFAIDMKAISTGRARSLAFTSLKLLESGKISGALNKRVVAKFFRLPSLFHPLERAAARTEEVVRTRLARRAREKERLQENNKPRLREKYATAKDKINEKIDPNRRAINNTLLVAAGLCIVREIAEQIPLVNYAEVVVPSMIAATDKQAVGSQNQSNQDFDLDGLADVEAGLTDDEGRTVWEGKALNALASNSAGQGEEIDPEYKQAFSSSTTTSGVLGTLNNVGNLAAFGEGGEAVSDFTCSTPGLILQGVAGIGLVILGPGGWAAKTVNAGAQTAATAAAIAFIEKIAINNLKADAAESFAGPQGGNLLAFGARASTNLNARSMGGVALSETEERTVMERVERTETLAFQQKGIVTRLFGLQEPRSLLAKMATSVNSDPSSNISGLFSVLLQPGKMFSQIISALSPKLAAQATGYDWSFPLYTVPDSILENEEYDDPYDNADKMVGVFDSSSGDAYIKRARSCFGVEIKKEKYGWDAVQVEEVNPNEADYLDADCANTSDKTWDRTIAFVFDTTIVTTIDCYAGGEESCDRIFTEGAAGSESGTTTGTPSGDVQSLAQQILAESKITYPLQAEDGSGTSRLVVEALARGEPAPVTCRNGTAGSTTSTPMNPNVLKFVLEYGQGNPLGVNALSDKCHSRNSNHYRGNAVDFQCRNVPFNLELADSIAAKYGGKRNSETCAGERHWHYDF